MAEKKSTSKSSSSRRSRPPKSEQVKVDRYEIALYAGRTIAWSVIATISIATIIWLYRPYWLQLYAQLYGRPASNTPVATVTSQTETTSTNVTLAPDAIIPTASMSATFLNDFLQAVIEATPEGGLVATASAPLLR
ncbi:hypothetical protein IJJ12_02785 [bacterium]|nr:hypothetical protein [bacterium]